MQNNCRLKEPKLISWDKILYCHIKIFVINHMLHLKMPVIRQKYYSSCNGSVTFAVIFFIRDYVLTIYILELFFISGEVVIFAYIRYSIVWYSFSTVDQRFTCSIPSGSWMLSIQIVNAVPTKVYMEYMLFHSPGKCHATKLERNHHSCTDLDCAVPIFILSAYLIIIWF